MHIDVDRTSTRLLTCADELVHVLFCRSYLSLHGNQLKLLPAAVFSNLTSLRSHVAFVWNENVCILGDTGTKHTHTGHTHMAVSVGDLADKCKNIVPYPSMHAKKL